MTVIEEKEYDYVNRQVEYNNQKIFESFNLFIKLMVSIGGGAIWLTTQKLGKTFLLLFRDPINSLFILSGAACAIFILLHTISWRGYRQAQNRINQNVPLPTWKACVREVIMIIFIIFVVSFACQAVNALYNSYEWKVLEYS